MARAREYEVEITKEASLKLSELLGNRLMMISMELQKLSLYVGKDATITEVEVGQLVAKTVEQDVFTLIDCVIHKRKTEALETLYELLRKKEEPIKILSLLARQFRNIYQVNELIKRGYSQQKVASSLKLHPYAVKLAHQQGRLFEAKRLLSYIDQLADADYQIKSGKMDKQLVLELFFTKVLND
ncbi:MAG: DNA polymerase III subunit delta [Bacillaceae bacterium]|nr:DNA polymerase III subunit delta [Bacillaceae bacterium]